ncbi:MAG: YybH family protein [Candidatus Acidiferrales bacterium]
MIKLGLFTMMFAVVVNIGCGARRQVNLSDEEAAIRRTDAAWLAAAAAHDLNRVLPFWADKATILAPGTPAVIGKEAIRKYVSGAFATPGFSITWKTEKVEVSKSGDLAYSTGTDRISLDTPDGKSVTEENRGVVIWKKQFDDSWKCVLDVMSPAESPNIK